MAFVVTDSTGGVKQAIASTSVPTIAQVSTRAVLGI